MSRGSNTAEHLFSEALGLVGAERETFLDRRCAGDAALRKKIVALLAAHETAGGFLAEPTIDLRKERLDSGDTIGRYTLVRFLGEGGYGLVYEALQTDPVERRVALKIIKPEAQSPGVLGRFDRERRTLARLRHPGIATLYDADETGDGIAYFVMEFLDGEPISHHCDATEADQPERLRLFSEACTAVQHAHEKGVLHGDLKPAHILIDASSIPPVPKVIDFGIAQALHGEDADFGSVVGTPHYMAPELLEKGERDPDMRSDVFALGVILRELLGAQHTSEELTWIIARATHPDPTQRYPGVQALLEELERYHNHHPVVAAPPSTRYRLKKFVSRNRGAVIAASLLLVSVILGVAGLGYGLSRASNEAREAKLQAEKAEFVASYFGRVILRADPYGEADPGIRKIVSGLADQVGKVLDTYPDVEARIRRTIAHVQFGEGQFEEAYTNLKIALDQLGSADPTEVSDLEREMGNAALLMKRFNEAETHFHRAIELREARPDDLVVQRAQVCLAACAWRQGRSSEARTILEKLDRTTTDQEVIHRILREKFRIARAEKKFPQAVALCEQRLNMHRAAGLPEDAPQMLYTRAERAQCLGLGGLAEDALEELRAVQAIEAKKFGEFHPVALDRRLDIAGVLFKNGKQVEAIAIVREVILQAEEHLSGGHKITIAARNTLSDFGVVE